MTVDIATVATRRAVALQAALETVRATADANRTEDWMARRTLEIAERYDRFLAGKRQET